MMLKPSMDMGKRAKTPAIENAEVPGTESTLR